MSYFASLALTLLLYVVLARICLSLSSLKLRPPFFALINIATFVWLTVLVGAGGENKFSPLRFPPGTVARHLIVAAAYLLLITAGFLLMVAFAYRDKWSWLAFLYPIILLVTLKYLPFTWASLLNRLNISTGLVASTVIGLSYMAFRLSYLVIEVRNRRVPRPTLGEYLGFAFFLPTILVGPINPYHKHYSSLTDVDRSQLPVGRCLLRIIVGLTKYQFLGNIANQLAYGGIFLDGKPHGFFDLAVAMVFYYLYLFCNFSGFCDIAIGVSGLIGIRVKENFNSPFKARNVKEFWNRWHITLSDYTKEVIFAPLSKALIKRLGVRHTNLGIALGILVVFLTIGVWHGVGWRFALFGLIHAVGVIANHYYTIWMKQRLGKKRYKAYNEHALVNAVSMVVTFGYVAMSFAVFANDYYMMRVIGHGLRAGLYVR